jgi:hypothetical protein
MALAADVSFGWRVIRSMLEEWGRWIEGHSDNVGYPSQAAIAGVVDVSGEYSWFRVKQFTAKGHSSLIFGGHRVLCLDMPERVRLTNLLIIKLPDAQYDAVLAEYGLGVKEDGTRFNRRDKARAIGITVVALEERLRRAHENISQSLAKATG